MERNIISNQVANAVNELKETIKNAIAEIKDVISENLTMLSAVKENLAVAHGELDTIVNITDTLAVDMDTLTDETLESLNDLEMVLEVIDPDNFGFEDEVEEEDYIEIEDENGDVEKVYVE